MNSRLLLYLKTGLIAIGILFGPDMLFAVVAECAKMVNEVADGDKMLKAIPIMLILVSCALWALMVGHWYVRAWFMGVAVVLNLWLMLDMLQRAHEPVEYSYALPWLVWTVWFSYRLVEYGERRKAVGDSRTNGS